MYSPIPDCVKAVPETTQAARHSLSLWNIIYRAPVNIGLVMMMPIGPSLATSFLPVATMSGMPVLRGLRRTRVILHVVCVANVIRSLTMGARREKGAGSSGSRQTESGPGIIPSNT